ncbi:MAG TPA: pilus assembly protein TadG-related protein [Dermatophilaceae bacterium]|nr:pilus assembly protein TadG-related protein [Dermatophilaceae bacterium]
MRRLSQLLDHREREGGAVTLLVAILLGGGVLLGSIAMTVDVGNLRYERRQLQNGADAAALSAAMDCAKGACPTASSSTVAGLVNDNAADGTSRVSRVNTSLPALCGAGPGLPSCPALSGTLGDCPTPLGPTPNYVRVYTQTRMADGSTLLPYSFAQALSGAFVGGTQQTCAAAGWGPPSQALVPLPFAISSCEWYQSTSNGTAFKPAPPYTSSNPANPAWEIALALNSAPNAACSSWAGHDYPGGFGWLTHTSSCAVSVDANGWVGASTGIGAGNDCGDTIEAKVGSVVYVPVFDCIDDSKNFCPGITPSGSNSWYHIKGLAAFYITAVEVTGQVKANLPGYPTSTARAACATKGGGKCFYGWFVKDLIPADAVVSGTAPDLGLTALTVLG